MDNDRNPYNHTPEDSIANINLDYLLEQIKATVAFAASLAAPIPAIPATVTATDGMYTGKVRVTWAASNGATYYEVYRNTSNSSSGVLQVGSPSVSPYNDTSAVVGTTYWYLVKACNSGGCSGFSASDSGYRATAIPSLILPADGAHVLFRRPAFDWSDVPGASGYNIQISRTAAFTTLVRNTTVALSTYTPASDLPAGIVLYWRVRAKVSGAYHGWSDKRSLTAPIPPSSPILKSPATGVLLRDYTPFLDWYDSRLPVDTAYGFDHYELQLATNTSFTRDVLNFTTAVGDRTASRYTIPDANSLIPNKTYHWHVRAYNTGGEYSTWSAASKFRTAILPPSLLAPPDTSPVGSRRPVFDWQDVAGAAGYKIQISRTPTFSTMVMQASVMPSILTPATRLPAGTTLYWRVQATGKNGPSSWSRVWRFTTP